MNQLLTYIINHRKRHPSSPLVINDKKVLFGQSGVHHRIPYYNRQDFSEEIAAGTRLSSPDILAADLEGREGAITIPEQQLLSAHRSAPFP